LEYARRLEFSYWLLAKLKAKGKKLMAKSKKRKNIMTTIIAIAAFIAVALVGWFIAETKGKIVNYDNNEQEQAVLDQNRRNLEQNGFNELNIKDVIRTIATTGYSAV
jgi:chorismate mutase